MDIWRVLIYIKGVRITEIIKKCLKNVAQKTYRPCSRQVKSFIQFILRQFIYVNATFEPAKSRWLWCNRNIGR